MPQQADDPTGIVSNKDVMGGKEPTKRLHRPPSGDACSGQTCHENKTEVPGTSIKLRTVLAEAQGQGIIDTNLEFHAVEKRGG